MSKLYGILNDSFFLQRDAIRMNYRNGMESLRHDPGLVKSFQYECNSQLDCLERYRTKILAPTYLTHH